MPLPTDDLRRISDAALSAAQAASCSDAEVRVERIHSQSLRLRDTAVEGSSDETEFGLGVRVVIDGAIGFAGSVDVSPETAAALVAQAVDTARITAQAGGGRVELAPEPSHGDVNWSSAFDVDPITVPLADKVALLTDWSARLLAADVVNHTTASVLNVSEATFLADLNGTRARQHRVRLHPQLEALATAPDGDGFETMRTVAPPAGRGWEYLTAPSAWDWDAELAQIPDHLAQKVAAPTVEAGDYDLVIDPTNLFLTIHESIGHATELDRAMGYEAAYAGTSFATFDQLGRLRYGSDVMHVTGDRTVPHGLATVAIDSEGAAGQSFDLVSAGTLVGYQLDRSIAAATGFARSNGCAFADSPLHIPIQRMANVSLAHAGPGRRAQPGGADRRRRPGHLHRRRQELVHRHAALQLPVHRPAVLLDCQRPTGRPGQGRGVPGDHHRLLGRHGGRRRRVDLSARWRLQLRQGPARPGGPGQPRLPLSARPRRPRPQRPGRGRPLMAMIPAQDVVEQALAAATKVGADGCIVMVEESGHADVRFARNTTTTNGVRRDRGVTVIIINGTSVGTARQSGDVDPAALVAAARTDALGSSPAEDAIALLAPADLAATSTPYDTIPPATDLSALEPVLSGLAPAFATARSREVNLAGFAEHGVATVYLGTSTGIRLAHTQPTSAVQLCGLTTDGTHTAWAGTGVIDDDLAPLVEQIWRRLDWGRTRRALDAGRYEVILPPSATADLMAGLYFYAFAGQDAEDGRTVFSAPHGRTRLGDTLSALPFTLASDPALSRASSAPPS